MVVRQRQFDDCVDDTEEKEEGQGLRDFSREACWCILRDDAATNEAPYFGPDVVVDDGEFGDEPEDGGNEAELGFGAAICLHEQSKY
jgi:hypothetical protein